MTAAELITRVAIRNGWSVTNTWQSRHHLVMLYVRTRNGPHECVEVRYPRDHPGVHSAHRIVDYSSVEYAGPNTSGRRAAAIRWLKL